MCPEKAPHLAIEAARRAGVRLVMAGKVAIPQEREYFDAVVKPLIDGRQVEFVGEADGVLKRELYRRARCFLAPIQWDEPFGLVMIEAMACGTPVIAFGRGGAAETVAGLDAPAPTGVLFAEQSAAAVAAAVREFEASAGRIDPAACRARAEAYAPERFRSSFLDFVRRKRAEWTGRWNARR
jgi:glycosyltransferase involved in cell wall biosynthesis